jgi:hypothetical protein
VDVCARERAAARPSTPAAIQALELPSCDLLRILQQALASQSTKSKKRRHGLRQQKPATATIPVQQHTCSPSPFVDLYPTSARCCSSPLAQPLPLRVSACPDGSDSRCLAPFCRCIWKQTQLLPRRHRASIAPTPGPVIHTPHPCRAATHSTAVQEHDFQHSRLLISPPGYKHAQRQACRPR